MSQQAAALEQLLRSNDLAWMIDLYTPKDRAIPFLLEHLQAVAADYRRRIHVDGPFTPEALMTEAERNPHKVRAFLQTLTATRSLEMQVMVWRILQGLSIRRVSMNYDELREFHLVVVLSTAGGPREELEEYRSEDIMDMRLLRNFGIGTVTGLPLFSGFSPPREMKSRSPAASSSV